MLKTIELPDEFTESADDIHARMLAKAPPNINPAQGDIFWDTTRPAANELAELKGQVLAFAIETFFSQTSEGQFLDLRAEEEGFQRRDATKSSGFLDLQGKEGTVIDRGTIFMAEASGELGLIEFRALENAVIDGTGKAKVKIECIDAGIVGNVKAGAIKFVESQIEGLESVTNPADLSGGTNTESDESLRERLLNAKRQESMAGSVGDYIRWAKTVDGVGNVYVIPLWNGNGTVKVLILDASGYVASQDLIDKVQQYIDPKSEGLGRGVAPIGAEVTVSTPELQEISISAKFEYTGDFLAISSEIKEEVNYYLASLGIGDTVKYKAIQGIVGQKVLNGTIRDYTDLKVNGLKENIELTNQIPVVRNVSNEVGENV